MGSAKMEMKTAASMREEAKRLRKEFEEYIEDLALYSNPEFWEAVRQKPRKRYASVDEFAKEKGFR